MQDLVLIVYRDYKFLFSIVKVGVNVLNKHHKVLHSRDRAVANRIFNLNENETGKQVFARPPAVKYFDPHVCFLPILWFCTDELITRCALQRKKSTNDSKATYVSLFWAYLLSTLVVTSSRFRQQLICLPYRWQTEKGRMLSERIWP